MFRKIIGAVVTVLLAGAGVSALTTTATATSGNEPPPDEQCAGTPPTMEYEYTQTTPGEPGVTEYRWQAVFKKGKELNGWSVDDKGTQTRSDDVWTREDGWHLLPEHLQPERFDGIAPLGTVPLSTYGGPSGKSAQYRYGQSYDVFHPGPTANDWTTDSTPPSAPSGSSWGAAKTRVVGATDSTTVTDWFESDPGSPWVATGESRPQEGTGTDAQWQNKYPNKPCYTPDVTITYISECAAASITVTVDGVPDTWIYGIRAEVDGEVVGSALVQGNGTNTLNVPIAEDQGDGEVTVRYYVHAATEWGPIPDDLNRQAIYPEVGEFFREFTVDTDCIINPEVCEVAEDGGTVTNLNPLGWTIIGGDWTEDGLSLSSDNWNDATVTKATSFNLSQVKNLALSIDTSGVTGQYGVGINLHTAQGDLRWEDIYTDEFWSNSPILPPAGSGQGGSYSGSLNDALVTLGGDIEVTEVTIIFSSAEANSALLHSASFNCQTVSFEWERPSAPPTPKPTFTEWVDGTWECNDTTVTQTRIRTDFAAPTWDGDQWVEDTTGTTTTETRVRDLTEDEQFDCPIPEKPDDKVTTGEWTDWTWECGDDEATRTRTVTTESYTWDAETEEWVITASSQVVETDTRPLTADELDECVIVPVDDTPSLASTGAAGVAGLAGLAGLLLLGGTGLMALRQRRKEEGAPVSDLI